MRLAFRQRGGFHSARSLGATFAMAITVFAAASHAATPIPLDPLPPRSAATPRGDKQAADLSEQLAILQKNSFFRSELYEVKDQTIFTSSTLATKRLSFAKGSVLILAPQEGDTVTIVADTIDIDHDARVAWIKTPAPTDVPPSRGEAPAGSMGRDYGEPGGPGLDGESGNTGLPGKPAPNLIIVYTNFNNGDLSVDLRGGPGGRGGFGQKGGKGGRGAEGAPARSGLIDCTSGAGTGGKGGRGGNGGPGGRGGRGGPGGTVLLVSLRLADAKNDLYVFNGDGVGGQGGQGGDGGDQGLGGRSGAAAPPFCREEPNRVGPPGDPGTNGKPGPEGYAGSAGPFIRVQLKEDEAARVFPAQ